MKSREIAFAGISLALVFLTSCTKPVIVFPNVPVASAYASTKGDAIEWDIYDTTQDFQISFAGFYFPKPPCKPGDTLHTDVKNKITKVTCHTQAEGTFQYQILPYPDPGAVPKVNPIITPYIQVGSCKGNCTGHGIDVLKGKKGPGYTDNAGLTSLPAIGIYCTSATTNPVVQNSPSTVQGNDVLKWMAINGNADSFGATFKSTDSTGHAVNSPCLGNNYGPFYGTGNACSIDPQAKSGDYYYAVANSNCTGPAPPPPPGIKITKQ